MSPERSRRGSVHAPAPPPAGPTAGEVPPDPSAGAAPDVRLVVVGESTAAGTGASTHDEALSGQLARLLARRGHRVTWRVLGLGGARARTVTAQLVPRLTGPVGDEATHVVVTIGMNDLRRTWRTQTWERDVTELLRAVRRACPDARVVISGLPDVRSVPALPGPLRRPLAAKGRRFGRCTERAAREVGAHYVPLEDTPLLPGDFSADRFHPGPEGYARWARLLVPALER